MVLYDKYTEIDLEKFDIYNQYRDQVCYMKVGHSRFNVAIDPDDWQKLKQIVIEEEEAERVAKLESWLGRVSPEKYGPGKEFDFTEGLLEKIILKLEEKFNKQ